MNLRTRYARRRLPMRSTFFTVAPAFAACDSRFESSLSISSSCRSGRIINNTSYVRCCIVFPSLAVGRVATSVVPSESLLTYLALWRLRFALATRITSAENPNRSETCMAARLKPCPSLNRKLHFFFFLRTLVEAVHRRSHPILQNRFYRIGVPLDQFIHSFELRLLELSQNELRAVAYRMIGLDSQPPADELFRTERSDDRLGPVVPCPSPGLPA